MTGRASLLQVQLKCLQYNRRTKMAVEEYVTLVYTLGTRPPESYTFSFSFIAQHDSLEGLRIPLDVSISCVVTVSLTRWLSAFVRSDVLYSTRHTHRCSIPPRAVIQSSAWSRSD